MNDRKGWTFLQHNLKKTVNSEKWLEFWKLSDRIFSKWQRLGKSKNKQEYTLWEMGRRITLYKKLYDKNISGLTKWCQKTSKNNIALYDNKFWVFFHNMIIEIRSYKWEATVKITSFNWTSW